MRRPRVPQIFLLNGTLLLCACSSGGFGGERIDPAETTIIRGEQVSLTVEAGTFAEGVDVKLSEGVTDLNTLPSGTSLSTAARLEFSKVALVRNDVGMTFALQISPDSLAEALTAGKIIHAWIQITGNRPAAGEMATFTGWQEALGTLDQDAATFTIPLFATAEQIDVVVVSAAPLNIYVDPATPSALTVRDLAKVVIADWQARPWAIVCKAETLPAGQQGLCDVSSADFVLQDFVELLQADAFWLSSLGWDKANLQTEDVAGLAILAGGAGALGLPEDFDETAQFNVVFFTHETKTACGTEAGIVGCYNPNTARLELTNLVADPSRAERIGDAVAHELFHAIQAVEIPNIDDLWILEGTAEAHRLLEPRTGAMPVHSFPGGRARRRVTGAFL